MRYLRYLFLLVFGLILLVVASANRAPVTLKLLSDDLAAFAKGMVPQLEGQAFEVTLPLFVVLFGCIVLGLLIGFVWEWLRESKHRSRASTERRAREKLEREVDQLRKPEPNDAEGILAILDDAVPAR